MADGFHAKFPTDERLYFNTENSIYSSCPQFIPSSVSMNPLNEINNNDLYGYSSVLRFQSSLQQHQQQQLQQQLQQQQLFQQGMYSNKTPSRFMGCNNSNISSSFNNSSNLKYNTSGVSLKYSNMLKNYSSNSLPFSTNILNNQQQSNQQHYQMYPQMGQNMGLLNRNRYMPYQNRFVMNGPSSAASPNMILGNCEDENVPLFNADVPCPIYPYQVQHDQGKENLSHLLYEGINDNSTNNNKTNFDNGQNDFNNTKNKGNNNYPLLSSFVYDENSTFDRISPEKSINLLHSSSNCNLLAPSDTSPSPRLNTSTASGSGVGEIEGAPPGNQSPLNSVTLLINNLDYTMDEITLRNFLLNQLKPITPVLSLVFEGSSYAKVTVPDAFLAKQVISNLHRKKIGHKRMIVSYTRDSSQTESTTLRCQVAGLLKDVPYCTLPMYKFRELFQSRFKTSISVTDLHNMPDICQITTDKNDEKHISLHPDLIESIESSPLMACLQNSVPYCPVHFKHEQHKGWAEQDIEPLPNVFMTISSVQSIIYPLLKKHSGDIPISSIIYCISGELGIKIDRDEDGVNFEHLICCVYGVQIKTNNFGIKVLDWSDAENTFGSKDLNENRFFTRSGSMNDPLYQISREVVELIKTYPKSTMKFNRFIPAYHNHFGKQCRVAEYGYTKLIELFEALSSVVQVMGDGENRQITLTHRTQIRRFTSDLLRILRSQGNKSLLLSELPKIFSQTQSKSFEITDYGVCDISDILDGLVNSNIVVLSKINNGKDIVISIPKRKQTQQEIEKTCVFAGEVVELFRDAPQYTILFQKFVRSYHYHFGYQCRLSDYGFLKLIDLMEAIQGVVEVEQNNDEDKKIILSPKVARRVFSEQLGEIIRECTNSSVRCMIIDEVLQVHKKKYGYQIQPQILGHKTILEAIKALPYIELLVTNDIHWIISHINNEEFRTRCYQVCKIVLQQKPTTNILVDEVISSYEAKYNKTLTVHNLDTMKHVIEIKTENDTKSISVTPFIIFIMDIIKLLEKRYVVKISDIKIALNISIANCSEFGYANLYTLLKAYPDVFVIYQGQTQDSSEIGLVAQNELVSKSYGKQNFTSKNAGNLRDSKHAHSKPISPQYRQPLSNKNGTYPKNPDNTSSSKKRSFNTSNNSISGTETELDNINKRILYNKSGGNNTNNNSGNQQKSIHSHNKENYLNLSNNVTLNGSCSFNSSSLSDLNVSSESVPSFVHISNNSNSINTNSINSNSINSNSTNSNIHNSNSNNSNSNNSNSNSNSSNSNSSISLSYNQNSSQSQNNGNDDCSQSEVTNFNSPLALYFGPPKPDSPPKEKPPYWIDPVWLNKQTDEEALKSYSLNIKLPELKTTNFPPMMMSPYTLSKIENMQKLFPLEKADKKI